MLLTEHVDVNERNNDGWTALMYASKNGYENIVEMLIKLNYKYLKKNLMSNKNINWKDKILLIECVSALPDEKFVLENDIPLYKNYYGALFYYLDEKCKIFYIFENPSDILIKNINGLKDGSVDINYLEFLKA